MSKKRLQASGDAGSYVHCPNGHRLPRKTEAGECTPLWCAGRKASKDAKPDGKGRAAPSGADAEFKDVGGGEVKQAALARVASAVTRREVRREILGDLPTSLEGEEAEQWAQKRIIGMLPDAVAEVEYQLKFGDDKQRAEAADRVLDMTGYRRREQSGQGGQTIILNIAPGGLPWDKPAEKSVEGTVTREKVDSGKTEGRQAPELSADGAERL